MKNKCLLNAHCGKLCNPELRLQEQGTCLQPWRNEFISVAGNVSYTWHSYAVNKNKTSLVCRRVCLIQPYLHRLNGTLQMGQEVDENKKHHWNVYLLIRSGDLRALLDHELS